MVNADLMDAIDRTLREARHRPREPFAAFRSCSSATPISSRRSRRTTRTSGRTSPIATARRGSSTRTSGTSCRSRPASCRRSTGSATRSSPASSTAVRHDEVTQEMADLLNEVGARPVPEGEDAITPRDDERDGRGDQRARARRAQGVRARRRRGDRGRVRPGRVSADESLEIKVGARVMFLRNDISGDARWVNGTTGVVTSIGDSVEVEVDGTGHEVEPMTWEKFRYEYDAGTKRLKKEGRRGVHAVPAPPRLGRSPSTSRRVRPMTVRSSISAPGAFAPGQTYVALSPPPNARRAPPLAAAAPTRHHRRRRRAEVHVVLSGPDPMLAMRPPLRHGWVRHGTREDRDERQRRRHAGRVVRGRSDRGP